MKHIYEIINKNSELNKLMSHQYLKNLALLLNYELYLIVLLRYQNYQYIIIYNTLDNKTKFIFNNS